MAHVSLVATRAVEYNSHRFLAGEAFLATPDDAALLVQLSLATLASDPSRHNRTSGDLMPPALADAQGPIEVTETDRVDGLIPAKAKRTYKRRDLTAEP